MNKNIAILAHVIILILLFTDPYPKLKQHVQKVSINLKKISSHQPIKTKSQTAPRPPQKTPITKPKQSPVQAPKKTIQKPAQAIKKDPKLSTKSKPESKKPEKIEASSSASKETIAKIAEKIDKLEQITKGDLKHELPQPVHPIEEIENDHFSGADVAVYLFQILELPGPGKVTVEMTLDRQGKIEGVQIIDSENIENSQYLMNELKGIVLPFDNRGVIPRSLKVCFSNLKA
jgi:outer membrane biosynthesis protein TonB